MEQARTPVEKDTREHERTEHAVNGYDPNIRRRWRVRDCLAKDATFIWRMSLCVV